MINFLKLETPIGEMIAADYSGEIVMLEFGDRKSLEKEIKEIESFLNDEFYENNSKVLIQLKKELDLYFNGDLKEFSLPLLTIGTDFQRKVWDGLLKIPYGSTISYKQESESLEMPKAVRAVANANGRNRISIIIPCHRVIGSNGTLTGYGGGLNRKEFLLNLEKNPS